MQLLSHLEQFVNMIYDIPISGGSPSEKIRSGHASLAQRLRIKKLAMIRLPDPTEPLSLYD